MRGQAGWIRASLGAGSTAGDPAPSAARRSCELSILAARTDVRFLGSTIPHLVRACRFPFRRRVLLIDTVPLGPAYRDRPGIGTLDELRACADRLVRDGIVDEVREIDYSTATRERLYRKHFDRPLRHTHNHRGYPILGSILAIEQAEADYLVHFDSDMLLYQDPGWSWIEAGMRLLEDHPRIAAVLPHSGPPSPDGRLIQDEEDGEAHVREPLGFYSFETFTSRVFLIDRRRFLDELLQLHPPGSDEELLSGESRLPPWEEMVGARLAATGHVRIDLDSSRAWSLHPPDHGPEFVAALPTLLLRIERGWFPAEQAGRYDLVLEAWQSRLAATVR
jgi:hypothetical protein